MCPFEWFPPMRRDVNAHHMTARHHQPPGHPIDTDEWSNVESEKERNSCPHKFKCFPFRATPTTSLIMPSWAFPCYSSAQILLNLWVTINSLDSYCIWNADNNHSIHKSLFRVSFLPSLVVAVVRRGAQTRPRTRPGHDDDVNSIIHFNRGTLQSIPSCTFFVAFSSSSHSIYPISRSVVSLTSQANTCLTNGTSVGLTVCSEYEYRLECESLRHRFNCRQTPGLPIRLSVASARRRRRLRPYRSVCSF